MLKRLCLMMAGALAATAPSAYAADVILKLVYVESVDSSNVLLPYSLTSGTIPVGTIAPTDRHRFAYLFQIVGQAANESLQALQTRVVRTGWNTGAAAYNTAALLTGYGAFSNPSYDPPQDPITFDDPPPRNLFKLNSDDGSSIADYATMRAFSDVNDEWYAAHYFNPGEGANGLTGETADGYYLGRMTFSLATPNTPGTYTLSLEQDGPGTTGFFTMWQGGSAVPGGTVVSVDYTFPTVIPSTFTITVVPEPATVLLMGLALPAFVCLARRQRRRTNESNNPGPVVR